MKKWILNYGTAIVCCELIVLGAGYLWLKIAVYKSLPQISGGVS
jgi:hypothetical protein